MAGALGGRSPPLVVDLGGGDVAVAEEVLDLYDIHVGVEQERGRGRPQGGGSVDQRCTVEPRGVGSSLSAPGSRSR